MATYYIDPVSGSDSNNGTSTSTPVASWNAANIGGTTLAPGDSRLFKSGTVSTPSFRMQFALSGTPTAALPITFGMYGGTAKAIIDGIGVRDYGIYPPNNDAATPGRYVIVEDLEIRNFTISGIHASGVTGNIGGHIARRCWVHDIGGLNAAIKLIGSDNRVEGCEVHDTGADGIFVQGARQYVGHNTISNNGKNNTPVSGDDCIQAGADSPDSLVEFNVCNKSGRMHKQALLWLGSNSVVRYNECYGVTNAAGLITLQAGTAMQAIGNRVIGTDGIYVLDATGPCSVVGNIIVCTTPGAADVDSTGIDANVAGHTFQNNTIVGMRRGVHGQGQNVVNNIILNCTVMGIYAGTGTTSETNNCLFGNAANIRDNALAPVSPSGTDVLTDPQIRSDYMPMSAAVRSAGVYSPRTDFYGRRFHSPPTIGAVQYDSFKSAARAIRTAYVVAP